MFTPDRIVTSGGGRSQRPGEPSFVAEVTVAMGNDSILKPPCYISRSVLRYWEVLPKL